MQNNFIVECNYELMPGIDGFYRLYYQGKEVHMVHDDALNQHTDDSEDYLERLHAAVGMYEVSLDL
jgi:hypothetical protein